jgi:3'-phosphoadenosine 5'-phosphosulfate sulfotransferase (PAPS reductase)/FAD synthetase
MREMTETTALTREELNSYDHVLVMFSGGKDSWACLLHLLDMGVDRDRIEIWHHDVDGREGGTMKMDWPCTADYCRAAAAAFDLPVYFSWKQGGFEGEMLRENARTRPTSFETPEGVGTAGGTRGKETTRRRFPQVSADLSTRWCSAYLKIDVATTAINNQPRFRDKRTLVVTGERAEESAARSKYKTFEPHKSDNRNGKRVRRHVDHYRPVHKWSEGDVWAIMERYGINPHPCYRLGFNRASCFPCIFGGARQFATVKALAPELFETMAGYEEEFGVTLKRKVSLRVLVEDATPYDGMDPRDVAAAFSKDWREPIVLPEGAWVLPKGAFGSETCGAL